MLACCLPTRRVCFQGGHNPTHRGLSPLQPANELRHAGTIGSVSDISTKWRRVVFDAQTHPIAFGSHLDMASALESRPDLPAQPLPWLIRWRHRKTDNFQTVQVGFCLQCIEIIMRLLCFADSGRACHLSCVAEPRASRPAAPASRYFAGPKRFDTSLLRSGILRNCRPTVCKQKLLLPQLVASPSLVFGVTVPDG